jgi:hypothetical protein
MTVDSRTYQREYARRKRRAAWARVADAETLCPALLGNRKPCRWPLGSRLVNGATVPFCAQCDRKSRGVCIDCQREPVVGFIGKALRCGACEKLASIAAGQRYKDRHPGKIRAQWRRRKRRLLKDPVARQAFLERKRLWRLASPKAKQRYAKQWNESATAKAYYKAYREARRELLAAKARAYGEAVSRGERPTHPCVTCGAAVAGRAKKCEPCRTTAFRSARAALTGAAA